MWHAQQQPPSRSQAAPQNNSNPGKRPGRDRKRKVKKRELEKNKRQQRRQRVHSGVPEQESGSSLVQIRVRTLVALHILLRKLLYN